MAAIVAARCDDCGRVEVPGLQITLAVWPKMPELSTYSFKCPQCGRIQTWPADGPTQRVMVMGGVPVKVMRLPEQRTSGVREDVEPLTVDSLIDLNKTLRETNMLTELLEEEEK